MTVELFYRCHTCLAMRAADEIRQIHYRSAWIEFVCNECAKTHRILGLDVMAYQLRERMAEVDHIGQPTSR